MDSSRTILSRAQRLLLATLASGIVIVVTWSSQSPWIPLLSVLVLSVAVAIAWRGPRRFKESITQPEVLGLVLVFGLLVVALMSIGIQYGSTHITLILIVISLVLIGNSSRRWLSDFSQASGVNDGLLVAVNLLLALGLLGALASARTYDQVLAGDFVEPHPDMVFFEALSSSGKFGSQGEFPFTPGGDIRYHWFAYSMAGLIAQVLGTEPFFVLIVLMPLMTLVTGGLMVVGWARSLNPSPWVPSLAAVLFVLGGNIGVPYGGILNTDSPSQSLSVVWLIALAIIFLKGVRQGQVQVLAACAVLVALLSAVTTGTKVSSGVVAAVALSVTAIVGLVLRKEWARNAAVLAAVGTASAAGTFFVFILGSRGGGGIELGSLIDRLSSFQGLNPAEGSLGVLLGTGLLLIAVGARWAGLVWLVIQRSTRSDPTTLFGVGLAIAGLLPLLFLSGFNAIWFSTAASGPLAAITAAGVGSALSCVDSTSMNLRRTPVLVSLVAGLVSFSVVWLLWGTGASGGNLWQPTLRWLAPIAPILIALTVGSAVALVAKSPRRWMVTIAIGCAILTFASAPGRLLGFGSGQVGQLDNGVREEWFTVGFAPWPYQDDVLVRQWTPGIIDAASWLRANAPPNDLIATNVVFDPLVPALSGLRAFVAGTRYQDPYGPPDLRQILLERETQSLSFIDQPSNETLAPLCEAKVRWVWVDPQRTDSREWEPLAAIRYKSSEAIVLEVNAASCLALE